MLAKIFLLTGGDLPLIGVGGIDSDETALAKIEAGASLVQLYTGLVFEGPPLIGRIKRGLLDTMQPEGFKRLAALTGRKSEEWSKRPLP
jgi:dihydroorotate dehydrogenase